MREPGVEFDSNAGEAKSIPALEKPVNYPIHRTAVENRIFKKSKVT